jgi:hypothetical protein
MENKSDIEDDLTRDSSTSESNNESEGIINSSTINKQIEDSKIIGTKIYYYLLHIIYYLLLINY